MNGNNVFSAIVELLLLTAVYRFVLQVFRHTRAIYSLVALVSVFGVLSLVNTYVVSIPIFSVVASGFLHYLPLIVLILFQEEIRRYLAEPVMHFRRFARFFKTRRKKETQGRVIQELVKAVCCLTSHPEWRNYLRLQYGLDLDEERLSKSNTGALIAIEGEVNLAGFRERGVQLDCQVNYRLLRSLFYPGSALHDGGVILRSNRSELRIAAAGCHFPALENAPAGPTHTRQNAVYGLAAKTDAFILMVSEETGGVLIPDPEDRRRIHRLQHPQELQTQLELFLRGREEGVTGKAEVVDTEETSPVLAASALDSREKTEEGR